LNVKYTHKRNDDDYKGRHFFGEEQFTPQKILATLMRKGPPPRVGMGPLNG